ncbi:acyl-CoA dehydrogenase [Microbacterium sp. R86528]|uniref:acyl-CoA dehydrogenase n=1 Tax=Microbacterium sp. R86528 TaxID=3093864 RepID=UPI0037CB038E
MAPLTLDPRGSACSLAASALGAAAEVDDFGIDVAATLDWCQGVGQRAPMVGDGATRQLWELLAATARLSVSAARMLEPHLDALSILEQSSDDSAASSAENIESIEVTPHSTWGVFAAEAADLRLAAIEREGRWELSGTKPWCSLGADLTHALVTATRNDGRRQLFAVNLGAAGVEAHTGPWFARGLSDVVSAPITFEKVPAVPVGEPGWYLTRPGFAWGGMSVAACWWGAAEGVAKPLQTAAASDRADQLARVHLGNADAALWAARATLSEAADLVDSGHVAAAEAKILAERVRTVVAGAATRVLAETDAALGPAPLVADDAHARRVADLHLYLRQHHGLRDSERLGRNLVAEAEH